MNAAPLLLLPLLLLPAIALAGPTPPETPRERVVDELHGEKVGDDYRWLEGDADGKVTEKVAKWTDAQNAYTREVLDGLPGRKEVEARIRELMTVGSIGAPTMRGNLYFNRERKGEENHSILYLREGHDGEPRVLIDVNALDPDGLTSLDWYTPSHDGALLAYGLSRKGDENSTLHVMKVATGEKLPDTIGNKVGGCDWLPDHSGFFYSHREDLDDAYSRRIRFHRLGTDPAQDPVLFEQHSTTWGPFSYISEDGHWLILGYYQSTSANDLWVVDLDKWFRTGEFVKVDMMVGHDARGYGPIVGDTMFLSTTLDAPNRQVFAVDLHRPAREHWKVVIPERKDAVLRGISLARGMLVATYLKDASTRIERFRCDGESLGAVELPGIGSAGIGTERDRTEAYLSFSSFNEPRSIYRVDLAGNERKLWARPDVPVDPALLEVKQVRYPSKDGTQISMFLVHRKGLKQDGSHPVLLNGYGGFNIPMTPRFSATLFQWFEAGGVYALPNLRGGGEYGDAWHRAGQLGSKQNVFDDFIAAAEWLIAQKYTTKQRLAISGRSNGGLLTGAMVVQRPDLFRAAIVGVPLLDMLRYQRFLMARFWVPEYGTAEKEEHYAWLRAYSPYQNVKPKTAYPAVYLHAGENDTRVHPLHARKMAAALQAATTSSVAEQPILLWVDRDSGHGAGKPLALRIRDIADERLFLMWQLGMLGEQK